MQTTTTTLFSKAERWCAYIFTTAFILTFLLLMTFIPHQSQAQQNPQSYPFSLDLNLGSGLIGNPSVSSAFQPELGFSYMPGKLGAGLNAGFISYNSSFNADQYASGFEDFTSITKHGEKWTSFFVGIGPRFEFGSGSRLPITFRSSLDLALTYNSPPESSVDFNDPTGSSGDSQLQLTGFNPGDNYSKWSAALRPEFQIQFSPGGSERFAINVTTGIQHRLTKNEFTYTQKDLSKVRRMDNPQEMFFQFNNAPEIQRRAAPPQTNFSTSVGIKIKFGKPKQLHKERVIHLDIASRAAPDGSETGDCDDSDDDRCIKPGEMASDDADSDGDGIDDGTEMAQDYNSSRSNRPRTRTADGGGDCDDGTPCPHPGEMIAPAQDYNSSRSNRPRTIADRKDGGVSDKAGLMAKIANPAGTIISTGSVMISSHPDSPIYEGDAVGGENVLNKGEMNDSSEDDFSSTGVNSPIYEMADDGGNGDGDNNTEPLPSQRYDMQPSSYCMEVATMKMSTNSQKAMRNSQNGDMNTDDTAMATSHNASRSNRSSGIINDDTDTGDIDMEGDSTGLAPATSHNASRSNRSQGISNDGGDTGSGMDSTQIASATDYNSSRSNTTSSIADLGGDLDGDGFPDMLKNASFSISKRSARTGRSQSPIYENETNVQTNPMYESEDMASGNGGDLDGDGLEDAVGIDIELEMGDPDSDDDGLMDAIESATYSISKRSARTGRTAMKNDQEDPHARESNWQESPEPEVAPPGNVHQWTYKLNALSDGDNMPGNGALTVIVTGGKVHFNVHFDPDSDEDGYGELLQNSSFSISKRSARTGRNPQSSRE